MAQTNVNIRMDAELKKQLDLFCSEIGITASAAFNIFAKAVVRQQRIPFELSLNTPNETTVKEYLLLGPFQGKTACIRIPSGRGVCGTAHATGEIQLVKDVHEFPGHIACDSASNSEIVLPIRKNGKIVGVLDIDSPCIARFDEEDKEGLQKLVEILEQACEF